MMTPRLHPTRPRVESLEARVTPTNLPSGFTESLVAGGLHSPTAMALAPDGRLFVLEQAGAVRVVENGVLLPAPFLTVPTELIGERGLLGIAFDPNFVSDHYLYLFYTVPGSPSHNRISRFTAVGDAADPASELDLADLPGLSAGSEHNGGAMAFGPDGKLYVGVGDNLMPANGQDLTNPFGKLLRLNSDGSVPLDDPFSATATGLNRAIWAYGLRNPFTFAFQPGSGRLFINDVGENTWEEIDPGQRGANYGWPQTEGPTNAPGITGPLYAYSHGGGTFQGGAVTGGAFYNPGAVSFPASYRDEYFFADFVRGWIHVLNPATGAAATFADSPTTSGPVGLLVTDGGDLLYLARGDANDSGAVYRISFPGPGQGPTIDQQPADQLASVGQPATFTAVVSGPGPLVYQWQRDDDDIPDATDPTYTLPAAELADDGAHFRLVVMNANGAAFSDSARLSVTADQPPAIAITAPAAGTTFRAGDTLTFAGSAVDAQGNPLPADDFTWQVDYHTGSAPARPFVPPTPGVAGGSFTVPTDTPYKLADVFYRITLTVTLPSGLTTTATRDLMPVTAPFTLTSNVSGATLALDGQPVGGGVTVLGVAGINRTLGAPAKQVVRGRTWYFVGWSDGGAATHVIGTPDTATTYTATYRPGDLFATGTGLGGAPMVNVLDAASGSVLMSFLAYTPAFHGGVRVAIGDVDGDGVPDIVTAPGPGGGPHIEVFSGVDGHLIRQFFAYDPRFAGGVYVAVGDVNGDGKADIITGAGAGGGPHVKVFSGADGSVLQSFFAYAPTFTGGVYVAAGDVDGDGKADVVTGAGAGGSPQVGVFGGPAFTRLQSFYAFARDFTGGVTVAAGDVNGDGHAEVIAATASRGGTLVAVFDVAAGALLGVFNAAAPTTGGGVRVATADVDGDGLADIITATGPGGPPRVRRWNGRTLTASPDLSAFATSFLGGVYVG